MSSSGHRPTRRTVLRQFALLSMAVLALQARAPAHAAGNAVVTTSPSPEPPATGAPRRLAGVKSWGYQLVKIDPAVIAKSPYDLVVIDYSRDGSDKAHFRPEEVAAMQRQAGGGRRILLAYLSIGEAEDYRAYWNKAWLEPDLADDKAQSYEAKRDKLDAEKDQAEARNDERAVSRLEKELDKLAEELAALPRRINSEKAPPWLEEENPDWPSNFYVHFWEKGWQDLIFGNPDAFLDKILAAGFDGVYLDRVDAIYEFERARPTARDEMVDFVVRMAQYARARKPAFIVVPQNGEELLQNPAYLAVIDGIAKEDLFYGTASHKVGNETAPAVGQGKPKIAADSAKTNSRLPVTNTAIEVETSLRRLTDATGAGLPVLVVEYFDGRNSQDWVMDAKSKIAATGFIGYIGVRKLDELVLPGQTSASAGTAQRLREAPASSPDGGASRSRKKR